MAKTIADHIFQGMCTKDLYKSNKGTSRAAIRAYVIQKGYAKDSPALTHSLRRAIKKLLDEGVIVVGTNTQRFLVNQAKKSAKLKSLAPPKKKAAPKKKATKKKTKSVKPKKKVTKSTKKKTTKSKTKKVTKKKTAKKVKKAAPSKKKVTKKSKSTKKTTKKKAKK